MIHRLSIPVSPDDVGEAFAGTDAGAQADMFNSMAKMLKRICGSDFGMQICYVAKDLDTHGKQMIGQLQSFVKMDEEDN